MPSSGSPRCADRNTLVTVTLLAVTFRYHLVPCFSACLRCVQKILYGAAQRISNYDNAYSIKSKDLQHPKQITSMQLLLLTTFIT